MVGVVNNTLKKLSSSGLSMSIIGVFIQIIQYLLLKEANSKSKIVFYEKKSMSLYILEVFNTYSEY